MNYISNIILNSKKTYSSKNGNRIIIFPLLIFALLPWSQDKQSRSESFKYSLRDTVQYDSQIFSAHTVSLYCNGEYIDNIDLYPGLLFVSEKEVIYRRIDLTPDPDEPPQPGMISGSIDKYYLFNGYTKQTLSTTLPDLSDYMSSLTVIDTMIYYWGLRDINDTTTAISAVKYDFKKNKASTVFLTSEWLATDNPAAFGFPSKKDSLIVYDGFGKTWLVNFNLNSKSRIEK